MYWQAQGRHDKERSKKLTSDVSQSAFVSDVLEVLYSCIGSPPLLCTVLQVDPFVIARSFFRAKRT